MKKKPKKITQFDLGLKQPRGNKIAGFRARFSKRFQHITNQTFLRSPYTWAIFFISTALVLVQMYYMLNFLDDLPPRVPVYMNSTELVSRLGSKFELLTLPLLSFVIVVATSLSGLRLYNSRKELIVFSLLNMLVSVGVLTLVVLQTFSIYI